MRFKNQLNNKLSISYSKTMLIVVLNLFSLHSFCQELSLNQLEYFEKPGVNFLVFSNEYNGMFFDEKTAGIEIIHHGVRTATGGAVRLQNTPEQWDLVPLVTSRKVNSSENSIEVTLRYEQFDFNSKLIVKPQNKGVKISIYLEKPLPEKLIGSVGFNLELLPVAYFEKSYLIDGAPGNFPLYPAGNTKIEDGSKKIPQFAGHTTFEDRGRNEYISPFPLAVGNNLVFAPEDPERRIKIISDKEIMLFDGRNLAQNGWFIVRELIPANKTGQVIEWYIEPNSIENWIRTPVIGFSQVGYHPSQKKVAVIELDKNDTPLNNASLFKVSSSGESNEVYKGEAKVWGKYLRYNYVKFDFSSIKDPGLYFIKYGNQKTNSFSIGQDVYNDIWHPTLDVWFPVQMDHMQVNEAYRTWHGVPFLDDALQAPLNHEHFDGYQMGDTTDTKYKPLEHIPGLAVGGWFDAGDFDIQTASHCQAILAFVQGWEEFGIDRDQTFIDQETRYVDIHRPDGKPDILQQIEHGVLNIVAQVKNIGHPVRGIVVPNLHQYHHLGDASTETDNNIYNPKLKPYQSNGESSGTLDDRWAFTTRTASLDFLTSGTLAAASRVLKAYNPDLANECLDLALQLYNDQKRFKQDPDTSIWSRYYRKSAETTATFQLFVTTNKEEYAQRFDELIWNSLDNPGGRNMSIALQAIEYMGDQYKAKLRKYITKYKTEEIDKINEENPYGVSFMTRGWGANGRIVNFAVTNYYAYKYYPEIIDREDVYKGTNYVFGCHPYSNLSFVSSVGTCSKKVTYGNNRADFTFIAGGLVPGLLVLKPDFPENKEDWPFLWGENECVIGSCAEYIFLSNAVQKILE